MNTSIKLSSLDCIKQPDVNGKLPPVEMALLLVEAPASAELVDDPTVDPEEFVAAEVVVAVC